MDNVEGIRRWQEQRGSGVNARSAPADEPRPERAPDRDRAPGSEPEQRPALPDESALDEARVAIIERRQIRWRLIVGRVLVFVAIPLLAVLLYIGLIATPLYQGEAIFTVQTSSDSSSSPTAGLFAITAGSAGVADAFKAREFILSRPMMEQMEERHGFLSHFASSKVDPLTRFNGPFGLNREPYDYYRKRVRVAVDVQEGILRLYVQARTPEDAVRFGNAILAAAEAHVNAFSEKISADQISALSRDVEGAERQVAETRRSLAAVQARRGELSPEQSATAIYQLISNLELQLAEGKRERDALLEQGLTDSPLLPRLNARVDELTSQIAEQRRRLVNPGGGSLATTVNEFETASSRKEIAQARWQSTLNTLQQAYLRILEQRRYFVIVVGMSAGLFPEVRDVLGIVWPILALLALIYALIFIVRRVADAKAPSSGSRLREMVQQWRQR
jgi:capsular polysaccharide transport system permease protein